MIRNIIFDIGNVLTDFRWRDFLRDKGFSEEMIARIAKASVQNVLWRELDRGVWSWEKLMQAFIAEDPEIADELHRAFDNMQDIVTIREYAIPWVKELKSKGYRVWYLSNFSQKIEIECEGALAFRKDMDGGILSYQDQLIKPDAAIYQLLLKRYDLAAQESVFWMILPRILRRRSGLEFTGSCFKIKNRRQKNLFACCRGDSKIREY